MNIFKKAGQKIKDSRVSLNNTMSGLEYSGKSLVVIIGAAIIVMFLTCLAVFFATLKGEEQVLVPNVQDKELTTALMEMQQKELYPKIQLRYTDSQSDEGKIIAQEPVAGSIVKAGARVTLTVSRGIIGDKVGDYIGKDIEEVKADLMTLFAGASQQTIILSDPIYKVSTKEAGTIVDQDPPAGTSITEPIVVNIFVSRGEESVTVPSLKGKSIKEIYRLMNSTPLIFDFNSVATKTSKEYGIVKSQEEMDNSKIPCNTRINVEISMPLEEKVTVDKVEYSYGIFNAKIKEYPYAVDMELIAQKKDGSKESLVRFNHVGGNITIPYRVEGERELILYVAEKEVARNSVY